MEELTLLTKTDKTMSNIFGEIYIVKNFLKHSNT